MEVVAQLLSRTGTEVEVSAVATRIVGRLFLPTEIPDDIVAAARNTLLKMPVGPVAYAKCAKAQKAVYEYVKTHVPEEHVADVCHNLGAAAQGVSAGLEALRIAPTTVSDSVSLRDELLKNPLIPKAARIAVGNSTVGGLLDEPLVKDKTFIMLQFGNAASETQDDNFLFGPGTSARQCPFKGFFFKFAGEVAHRLQELRRAAQR